MFLEISSVGIGLVLVIGLVFIIVIIVSAFPDVGKGTIGELTVATILSALDKTKYKVINNVVLEQNGKTTQIDHIVIADCGVFVIETKNFKGWIVGGEEQEHWTQVLFDHKYKLYNPIRQNQAHIWALKKCLHDLPAVPYISMIVFIGRATIKTNTITKVIYPSQLLHCIKDHTETALTPIRKDNIFAMINALNVSDCYDKQAHVMSIRQNIAKRENAFRENKCPRCRNQLVERKGKRGRFLGCKSYPKCRFTASI